MKKRLLCTLICVLLLCACLATSALAESAETYDVWVGGTQVTSANASDVLNDGHVSYTPATETAPAVLTLDNASISDCYIQPYEVYSIYFRGALNLELKGTNTISFDGTQDPYTDTNKMIYTGIRGFGDLTIFGDGTLTVNAVFPEASNGNSRSIYGIYTDSLSPLPGKLTVSGGTLNFVLEAGSNSTGIYGKEVEITGGTLNLNLTAGKSSTGIAGPSVNISGGVIDIEAKAGMKCRGISSAAPVISGGANVTVMTSGNEECWAVDNYDDGTVTVSGLAVTAGSDSVSAATVTDISANYKNYPYAHFESVSYPLWVGNVQVTGANMDNILGDTGTATAVFDPDGTYPTLTLNAPVLTAAHSDYLIYSEIDGLVIDAPAGLTLSGSGDTCGIYGKTGITVNGNITLDGVKNGIDLYKGDITVTGNITGTVQNCAFSTTNVSSDDNDLKVTGNAEISNSADSRAINIRGAVDISGDLTVTASSVRSNAVYANGSITIGGNLTVTASSVCSDAVFAHRSITIGGNAAINGNPGSGIYSEGWILPGLSIGGNVTGTVGGSLLTAYGTNADLTVGGNVNATSTETGSYAVIANRSVSIGGTVKITGASIGVYAVNGDIHVSSGTWDIEASDIALAAEGDILIPSDCSVTTPSGAAAGQITMNDPFGVEKTFNIIAEPDGTTPAKHIVINYVLPDYYYWPEYYGITMKSAENGSVSSGKTEAEGSEKVTLTVTPEKGYTLDTLTVKDGNGKELELTEVKVGEIYTFRMPYSKVNVEASFRLCCNFVDVPTDAWFFDPVVWAVENEITYGTDETHFSPYSNCTRAQMITFLWRAAGCPVVNYAMPFTDLEEDAYYTEAVRWAASLGISNGTSETTFSPDAEITREQLAVLIYNFAKTKGEGFTGSWMFLLDYDDAGEISSWADEAMHWCVMKGIVEGVGDRTLAPHSTATRAEIITMLYRYFAM